MSHYSIWVLEYGRVLRYPLSALRYLAHNEGTTQTPFSYVVLKGPDRVVMVDVGFDRQKYGQVLGDRTGVENWHSPAELLPEIGLTPDQVDDVVLTHLHFDHAGNTQAFPNAHFWLQRRELDEWLWTFAQPAELGFFTDPVDPDDLLRATRLITSGRMTLLDGDRPGLFPGIDVHAAYDTHTFGSLWVSVRAGDGRPVVMAGDNVNVYENLHGIDQNGVMIPVGVTTGSTTSAVLAARRMLDECDGDWRRVVPVHEARLPQHYPSRRSALGTWITEVSLADGEPSRVR